MPANTEKAGNTPVSYSQPSTHFFIRIVRIIKENASIALLAAIIIFALFFGYCIGYISAAIKFAPDSTLKFSDWATTLGTLIFLSGTAILKLYSPPGRIEKELQKKTDKPVEKTDPWGKSIPG